MDEIKYVRKTKVPNDCEVCGELAKHRLTFLLSGARSNPASTAYGRDDCSFCSDMEMDACEKCKTALVSNPPAGYEWCAAYPYNERFKHMSYHWKETELPIEELRETFAEQPAPELVKGPKYRCDNCQVRCLLILNGDEPISREGGCPKGLDSKWYNIADHKDKEPAVAEGELQRLKETENTAREFSQIPYTQARSELGSWRETFSILTNKDCYDQLMKAIKNTKKSDLLSHEKILKSPSLKLCPSCGKSTIDMSTSEPTCDSCGWAQ